ncbi:MAG: ABC transporter permease [Solirubrobacteraceae bacterium]
MSIQQSPAVATSTGTPGSPAASPRGRRPSFSAGPFFQAYGLLVVFIALILFFALERSSTFPTLANLRTILTGAAPLGVMAFGLTVPMIMGDFDLSIGYNVQVLGAVAVSLMAVNHFGSAGSILATIAIALGIGSLLGAVVAWSRVSAFVITLGAGIIFQGIELQITEAKTIFQGLSPSYVALASDKFLSFTLPVWFALAVAVALWYTTRHTVLGRRMAAVGGNKEAARLSGINVERMRTAGFVLVALSAAIAAIIITGQAASSYPDSASGLLIPAYAAVFLGASVLRPGEFHVWGTVIGVLFFEMIQDGLTLMNYGAATTNIVEGGVFVAAVLMSRIGTRGRR